MSLPRCCRCDGHFGFSRALALFSDRAANHRGSSRVGCGFAGLRGSCLGSRATPRAALKAETRGLTCVLHGVVDDAVAFAVGLGIQPDLCRVRNENLRATIIDSDSLRYADALVEICNLC